MGTKTVASTERGPTEPLAGPRPTAEAGSRALDGHGRVATAKRNGNRRHTHAHNGVLSLRSPGTRHPTAEHRPEACDGLRQAPEEPRPRTTLQRDGVSSSLPGRGAVVGQQEGANCGAPARLRGPRRRPTGTQLPPEDELWPPRPCGRPRWSSCRRGHLGRDPAGGHAVSATPHSARLTGTNSRTQQTLELRTLIFLTSLFPVKYSHVFRCKKCKLS